MNLEEHPGYLGWTSQGVIAIHANWPMYPAEHGVAESLWSLGQFPRGTVFERIDSIDRCSLFVVSEPSVRANPFDEKYFHVALWEEDVHELFRLMYVDEIEVDPQSGIKANIGRRALLAQAQWINRRFLVSDWETSDGEGEPPPGVRISLTTEGWRELNNLLTKPDGVALHPLVLERASPIAEIGLYDAAVREACVILESRLREIVASDEYGRKLVDKFIGILPVPPFIAAYNKVMRGDLRTIFKYIRNEYAHKLHAIDEIQCRALLARVSVLLGTVDAAQQTLDRERQAK